jgi:hypothetical protein
MDGKTLDDLAEQVRAESGFEVILVTDLKGSIIASARDDETSPDTLGALLDVATRITVRPEDRADLAAEGESVFFDWEGRQVICRWLAMRHPRLLVILAPRGAAYKRAISRLIKQAGGALGE